MSARQTIQKMYQERTPLVFGHRGAKNYAPMNTLAAFRLAAEQGAQGIELDVQRSRDGHAVVVHDFTVDATTDGTGTVTEMDLAELKKLDAGSWFHHAFAGETIPTLDEVFETVGNNVIINVEIKLLSVDQTDGVEQAVADVIQRQNAAQRVIVSSFNPMVLRRFREILPDVPIGFLYLSEAPLEMQAALLDFEHEAYHPPHELITPQVVAQAKLDSRFVNAWTVNTPSRAAELRDMGVDGIITDDPPAVLRALSG